MQLSNQPFIADTWFVTRSYFTERLACLCLLLITGPGVTVMLDFDNFRVMHNYKPIGELR